jgi:transcriptional regulator with XRE-family HTH domain
MGEKNLTQLDLAAQAGVDKNTVANLLRGESASTATLEKIARALGVDISELSLTAEQSRVLAEYHGASTGDLADRLATEVARALTKLIGERLRDKALMCAIHPALWMYWAA